MSDEERWPEVVMQLDGRTDSVAFTVRHPNSRIPGLAAGLRRVASAERRSLAQLVETLDSVMEEDSIQERIEYLRDVVADSKNVYMLATSRFWEDCLDMPENRSEWEALIAQALRHNDADEAEVVGSAAGSMFQARELLLDDGETP